MLNASEELLGTIANVLYLHYGNANIDPETKAVTTDIDGVAARVFVNDMVCLPQHCGHLRTST